MFPIKLSIFLLNCFLFLLHQKLNQQSRVFFRKTRENNFLSIVPCNGIEIDRNFWKKETALVFPDIQTTFVREYPNLFSKIISNNLWKSGRNLINFINLFFVFDKKIFGGYFRIFKEMFEASLKPLSLFSRSINWKASINLSINDDLAVKNVFVAQFGVSIAATKTW